MSSILFGFFLTWVIGLLLLRYPQWHSKFSADTDLSSVQKFHIRAVPRIGGIAIFAGIAGGIATCAWFNASVLLEATCILLAGLPVFLIGLLEDLTKNVGARQRLLGAFISAGLAGYLLDSWLVNVQFLGLDYLLAVPFFSVLFTCVSVAGVTNSFNLIDGYHGLVGMAALIILLAIAYVAHTTQDSVIMVCAFSSVGAIIGFLFWNYPKGRIFLGDGGAYLIGFWIAELSVLLVMRNPEVSKWFPVLVCFYPIFETLFTIYRRLFIKRTYITSPDALHLHQIIYARLVRWGVGDEDPYLRNQRNYLTSPYLWLLCALTVIPAVLFWNQKYILQAFIILFSISYICLYRAIVKFRAPKWMILKNSSF
jgi:UDP-N-acetylmuramyl pentapeptide phosphotransferase/UDP-N-acetylglucosamine-1-phosphate transferase